MTQRIGPFLKNMSHQIFLAKNFQRIEHFFDLTQRIEPSVWHDSKNRTFFYSRNWTFFFFFQIWIKELIFQKFHFKLLTFFFFLNMTHRIELFLQDSKTWELFYSSQRTVIQFWNNLFRVQFFESFCEEGSILWVKLNV